jgi:type IV pilus assembly protein PilV
MRVTSITMTRHRRAKGFSLLEALITIVVVAIGLLGVAGMQVASIKLADLSQTRTIGVLLANDIIDRIRANSGNVGQYATSFGPPPSAIATVADRDLREWKLAMANATRGLPSGDGSVVVTADAVCSGTTCTRVDITVRWDEQRQRGGRTTPQTFSISTRI